MLLVDLAFVELFVEFLAEALMLIIRERGVLQQCMIFLVSEMLGMAWFFVSSIIDVRV